MNAPFFILTTGRSGSLSLALTLNQHPLLCCLHEPHPALIPMARQAAVQRADARKSVPVQGYAEWFRDHVTCPAGPQIVGWCDQKLAPFVPDLAAAFPKARFIHLVRDGRAVVASGLARGWYSPQEQANPSHLWAEHRFRADELDDMPAAQWASLDAFARNCWYWSYLNRTIRQQLADLVDRNGTVLGIGTGHHVLLPLEDLVDDQAQQDLDALQEWLGVRPLPLPVIHANATRPGRLQPWQDWTPDQCRTFDKICGPEMDHLYPNWRNTWKHN